MRALFFSLAALVCLASAADEAITTQQEVAAPPLLMEAPSNSLETPPRASAPVEIPADNAHNTEVDVPNNIAARMPAKRSRTWMMSFGPGLAFYKGPDAKETESGVAGFSTQFGGVTQLTSDSPLFLGVNLGLQFWSFNSPVDRSATGVQVLPTAYYDFDWEFQSVFQPYLGLSVGPHFYFSRREGETHRTFLNFEALLRPGFTFLMARGLSINFEPTLGFIGSDPVFFPQVAANLFL